MGNIAIYGGSFDPPHKGHLLLAKNLAKECNADKVLIIPAYSSPFKDGSVAEGTDRLAMCKHTFTDPIFEISAIELNREGKRYTVDTIKDSFALHYCYRSKNRGYEALGRNENLRYYKA